jgi:hypothetical protein
MTTQGELWGSSPDTAHACGQDDRIIHEIRDPRPKSRESRESVDDPSVNPVNPWMLASREATLSS